MGQFSAVDFRVNSGSKTKIVYYISRYPLCIVSELGTFPCEIYSLAHGYMNLLNIHLINSTVLSRRPFFCSHLLLTVNNISLLAVSPELARTIHV